MGKGLFANRLIYEKTASALFCQLQELFDILSPMPQRSCHCQHPDTVRSQQHEQKDTHCGNAGKRCLKCRIDAGCQQGGERHGHAQPLLQPVPQDLLHLRFLSELLPVHDLNT